MGWDGDSVTKEKQALARSTTADNGTRAKACQVKMISSPKVFPLLTPTAPIVHQRFSPSPHFYAGSGHLPVDSNPYRMSSTRSSERQGDAKLGTLSIGTRDRDVTPMEFDQQLA